MSTEQCNCENIQDIRARCAPKDEWFKKCPVRVETAIWFIENGYADKGDFDYFTEDEMDMVEMETNNITCEVCHRDGTYHTIVGNCDTCSIENMCDRCGYFNEHDSQWYCEPCRDKAVEAGEWSQEESDDE
jgi:RecJ-like exonuclease